MADDQSYKVRENRARRVARRQGLVLRKNPRRDPRAVDYGSYMLVEDKLGEPALEADFGWTWPGFPKGADWLADVEAYLAGAPKETAR